MAKKVIKDKKGSKAAVAKPVKKSTAPSKKVDTKKTAKTAKVSSSAKSKAPVSKKSTAKPAASAKKASAPKAKVAAKKVATKATTKAKPAAKKPVAPKAKAVVKGKASVAKSASKPVAKTTTVKAKTSASKAVVSKKTAPVKPAAKKEVVVAKAKTKTAKPAAKVEAKPAPTKKAKEVVAPTPVVPPKVLVEKAASTAVKAKRGRKKKRDDDDDDDDIVVPPPPPKREKSTLPKRNPSKSAGDELTLEGPAPKKISPIDLTSEQRLKLKKTLLNKCIEIVKTNMSLAKKAMEEAMKSANEEKVTEELSDSFRETMHATREMYARQVNEASKNLDLLNRILISEHDRVRFGSIVFTNNQNYFICTGLGELKIDDKSFQTVSTLSPLFQILSDKKKGETYMFLDRLYTVVEVF